MPTDAKSAKRASATRIDEDNDALTDALLRQAARDEGLSYHDFCQKYGIIGPSQARKTRRHEINEADTSESTRRDIENRTAWGDSSLNTPNGSVITNSAPARKAD